MTATIIIDEKLKPVVMLGVLRLSKITLPEDNGDALWQELSALSTEMQTNFQGLTAGQIPEIAHARKLYRSIGMDPTRNRPSSEALLRRLLKGKSLYRIHPLVDLFNLVSLKMLTPVGLYDESKISGKSITIRVGGPGEGFDGIRKDRVNVENRFCLADDLGPFGSPTSDSLRTSVQGQVPNALAIFFQHASVPRTRLEQALDLSEKLANRHFGAEVELKTIIQDSRTYVGPVA
jgi:DNA/RNA-binding domain of Phe-tRNA-synthetase-like protein